MTYAERATPGSLSKTLSQKPEASEPGELMWVLEPNLGALQEQQVLLTPEPSL